MSGFKSWLATYYLHNLGQVTSSLWTSMSSSHRVLVKTNWDNIHKSCSMNWNRLHRCWLSLLAGLARWNSNYYLRKWPICIATRIFTVNNFDWDSDDLTAGLFHSLKSSCCSSLGCALKMLGNTCWSFSYCAIKPGRGILLSFPQLNML